ncbi:acetylglutamate kinase [Nanohaloarchaea archaeon]|nr:acetylglutamate kinase [Candidatus Nanohaloarchaea archaeon]
MEYVLKIGGSVLTDKGKKKTLSQDFDSILENLEEHGNGVLVHGAGSYGHPQAEKHGVKQGSYQGVLEVHRSISELNTEVMEKLSEIGLKPVPVHTSSIAYRNPETQLHLDKLSGILDEGFTPVLHGDIAPHKDKGFTIISGDEIVAKVEKQYSTGKAGFCSSVKGVLDDQGEVLDDINSMEEFTDKGMETTDVTGGMKGKVKQQIDEGVKARIFGKDDLEDFLEDRHPGTLVNPTSK